MAPTPTPGPWPAPCVRLTSHNVPRVEAAGFLAPVRAHPGAWWEVVAGLGSDVQHLEGDKSASHWGLLGRAGASFPCKGCVWGGVCRTTWGELCLGSAHGAKNQWGSGAASPGVLQPLPGVLCCCPGLAPVPRWPQRMVRACPCLPPRCPGCSSALPSCPRFEGCPAQMAGTFRLSEAGCFPPRDSGPSSVFTQAEQSTHGFLQELLQGVDPLAVSSLPLDDNAVAAGGIERTKGSGQRGGRKGLASAFGAHPEWGRWDIRPERPGAQ